MASFPADLLSAAPAFELNGEKQLVLAAIINSPNTTFQVAQPADHSAAVAGGDGNTATSASSSPATTPPWLWVGATILTFGLIAALALAIIGTISWVTFGLTATGLALAAAIIALLK